MLFLKGSKELTQIRDVAIFIFVTILLATYGPRQILISQIDVFIGLATYSKSNCRDLLQIY
jgi:hypothetical protein